MRGTLMQPGMLTLCPASLCSPDEDADPVTHHPQNATTRWLHPACNREEQRRMASEYPSKTHHFLRC